LEFGLDIEKIKINKSTGSYQIPTELFKAERRKFRYEIHKVIIYISENEDLLVVWKEAIVLPAYNKCDKIYLITIGANHCC
jgi:hypothetical protein